MAKKFGESPMARRFDEVAKNTMANIDFTAVRLIENAKLMDYPNNGEDISYTLDIENSIFELGFTDPIEVTDFGMPSGEYMIVSGHRRRAAGVKCGMDLFPCIIKAFKNETDVQNYVLLANSQRDSSKDPLLYSKRFRMHEQHLKATGFKGSVREEIAKRLGISIQQADRYNQMNKVIEPVWDMVREDIVGMSSVLPMAILSPEEQREIFEILTKAHNDGTELTRETVREIVKNYRNQDKIKSPEQKDFFKENFSKLPEKEKEKEKAEKVEKTEKSETTAKAEKAGGDIIQSIKAFHTKLSGASYFEDGEEAAAMLDEMEKLMDIMLDKSYFLGKKYGLDGKVGEMTRNLSEKLK